jgi:hypothetical protein
VPPLITSLSVAALCVATVSCLPRRSTFGDLLTFSL